MKHKFAAILVLLAVMAALPGFLAGVGADTSVSSAPTADSASLTLREAACAEASRLCDDSFCDEAIRAVIALSLCNSEAGTIVSGDNNSNSELYKRVCAVYDSSEEIKITFGGKIKPVPCSAGSNGQTLSSEEYPYLSPVASPWDCFSEEYRSDSKCVGVSLSGLNTLCKRGLTAEQALEWYLPGFEIKCLQND